MTIVNDAQAAIKTVADPNAAYESLVTSWAKCRVICAGEQAVKNFDLILDNFTYSNLLVPFSGQMTQEQYNFYRAEAELPGVTAQFSRMIVGGLLRKTPVLTLPKSASPEVSDWIMNNFGRDDTPLSSFLNDALWEEVQTSRAWIIVDHPIVNNIDDLTKEQRDKIKPSILWEAESIINWTTKTDNFGKKVLSRLMIKSLKEDFTKNEFHPILIETVHVHELNESGYYQIRIYEKGSPENFIPVSDGRKIPDTNAHNTVFNLIETKTEIYANDIKLDYIPAWPLNGNIEPVTPMLTAIVDKEVALYNKMSRRNHLLYGAATYTPYICSDCSDDEFDKIVSAGLGSWFRLRQGDTADVLDTPTSALQDMDRAIVATLEELARLGVRMMSPENVQSGIALELRNAAQTATLGLLNNKVSDTMKSIIVCMINWKYDIELVNSDIEFTLSADFNSIPLGSDWLNLATGWYENGLIPRSVWLNLLKTNDMIDSDYDDQEGMSEITSDPITMAPSPAQMNYVGQINQQKQGNPPGPASSNTF